jgi:hypothetical protein
VAILAKGEAMNLIEQFGSAYAWAFAKALLRERREQEKRARQRPIVSAHALLVGVGNPFCPGTKRRMEHELAVVGVERPEWAVVVDLSEVGG